MPRSSAHSFDVVFVEAGLQESCADLDHLLFEGSLTDEDRLSVHPIRAPFLFGQRRGSSRMLRDVDPGRRGR